MQNITIHTFIFCEAAIAAARGNLRRVEGGPSGVRFAAGCGSIAIGSSGTSTACALRGEGGVVSGVVLPALDDGC
jgi:hypothetical protein